MTEYVFTPAAVLDMLSQIDEFQHLAIGITETLDNKLQLQIGESIYIIDLTTATSATVDKQTIDLIETVNIDTYQELIDSSEDTSYAAETIESGVLKEIAKTLLVGGLIRLSAKLLK